MNTASAARRFTSFAVAAVLTLGMLFAIDGLATSDVSTTLLARVSAAAHV